MNVKLIKANSGKRCTQQLVDYVIDKKKTKGKVYSKNILTLATAALEIDSVASRAHHRASNTLQHWKLSWPSGETPSLSQMKVATTYFLKTMGFSEFQVIAAPHLDGEFKHIHILVNRVHPISHRTFSPAFAIEKAHYAVRKIEIGQGWEFGDGLWSAFTDHDTGKIFPIPRFTSANPGQTPRFQGKADAFEARTGKTSFKTYVIKNLVPACQRFSKNQGKLHSWAGLHHVFKQYDCEMQPCKSGYVISAINGEASWKAKLSDMHKAGWEEGRAETLEALLGPFEPRAKDLPDADLRYDPNCTISGRDDAISPPSATGHSRVDIEAKRAHQQLNKLLLFCMYEDHRARFSKKKRRELLRRPFAPTLLAKFEFPTIDKNRPFPSWEIWLTAFEEINRNKIEATKGTKIRPERPAIHVTNKGSIGIGDALLRGHQKYTDIFFDVDVGTQKAKRHNHRWPCYMYKEKYILDDVGHEISPPCKQNTSGEDAFSQEEIEAMFAIAAVRFNHEMRISGPWDWKIELCFLSIKYKVSVVNPELQGVISAIRKDYPSIKSKRENGDLNLDRGV